MWVAGSSGSRVSGSKRRLRTGRLGGDFGAPVRLRAALLGELLWVCILEAIVCFYDGTRMSRDKA